MGDWDRQFQGILQQGIFTQQAWNRADGLAGELSTAHQQKIQAEIDASMALRNEIDARRKTIAAQINLDQAHNVISRQDDSVENLTKIAEIDNELIKNLETMLNNAETDKEALLRAYNEVGRQMDNTVVVLQAILRKFPEIGDWMGENGLRFEVSSAKARVEIYKHNKNEVRGGAPRHDGSVEPDYLSEIYSKIANA